MMGKYDDVFESLHHLNTNSQIKPAFSGLFTIYSEELLGGETG